MTFSLPDPAEVAERAMLDPPGCCCETAAWFGKRVGPHVAPLTEAWLRMALATNIITPPPGERPRTSIVAYALLIVMCVAALAPAAFWMASR